LTATHPLEGDGRKGALKDDYLCAEGGPFIERKKTKFEYALSYHQRKVV
jgi:hypothetical protein